MSDIIHDESKIRKFCQYYCARVRPSFKKWVEPVPFEIQPVQYLSDEALHYALQVNEQNVLDIEITERGFEALLKIDEKMESWRKQYEIYRNYSDKIGKQRDLEREVRERVPAVQKAYDQYQILLKMSLE